MSSHDIKMNKNKIYYNIKKNNEYCTYNNNRKVYDKT